MLRMMQLLQVLVGRTIKSQTQDLYSHNRNHYKQGTLMVESIMVTLWKEVLLYPRIYMPWDAKSSQVVLFYQNMFFHLISTLLEKERGRLCFLESLDLTSAGIVLFIVQ